MSTTITETARGFQFQRPSSSVAFTTLVENEDEAEARSSVVPLIKPPNAFFPIASSSITNSASTVNNPTVYSSLIRQNNRQQQQHQQQIVNETLHHQPSCGTASLRYKQNDFQHIHHVQHQQQQQQQQLGQFQPNPPQTNHHYQMPPHLSNHEYARPMTNIERTSNGFICEVPHQYHQQRVIRSQEEKPYVTPRQYFESSKRKLSVQFAKMLSVIALSFTCLFCLSLPACILAFCCRKKR